MAQGALKHTHVWGSALNVLSFRHLKVKEALKHLNVKGSSEGW